MLVALIARPYRGEPSRMYEGMPPMEPGEADARVRMPIARVLVIESRPDGIFPDRFDESGEDVGDTWHESIEYAKEQATDEYGDHLSAWTEVPVGQDDPVAFALKLAGAGE